MELREALREIKEKQNEYNFLSKEKSRLEEANVNLDKEISDLSELKEIAEQTSIACKRLIEELTRVNKERLERFLTFVLRNIFTDREYSIELELKEETKRAGLSFMLVENGERQEITDAIGGGIISVLGLFLQVYYINVYGLRKILFIDEGLKEISSYSEGGVNYLENTLKFLKYLSREKDFTFLIITHDNFVREESDVVFEISKGELSRIK